jgi:hypothetical protein
MLKGKENDCRTRNSLESLVSKVHEPMGRSPSRWPLSRWRVGLPNQHLPNLLAHQHYGLEESAYLCQKIPLQGHALR